ncbi:MAG: collagen-like protein [Proteobacteria bacterium]|nr:collagen-like protein [Pseudomonadota bacterium]
MREIGNTPLVVETKALLFALLFVLLIGCAGDAGPAGEPGAPGEAGPAGPAGDPGPAPSEAQIAGVIDNVLGGCRGLTLSAQEWDEVFEIGQFIASGEEREVCSLHRTGPEDLFMSESEVIMNKGSHHGLLFLTGYTEVPAKDLKGEPVELGKVVPCEDAPNSRFDVTSVLSGSQGTGNLTADGQIPEGVALRIPANSLVVMNYHLLNATDEDLSACMKIGLKGIPRAEVQQEAGVLFFYNPFISVPAQGMARARMACPMTQDIQLGSAVSHMHARGVGYSARWLDASPYDPSSSTIQMLYETTEWEAPEPRVFETPLELKTGQWIDYECQYENPEQRDVAQGLDTSDEMCMFIGLYWPKNDALSNCAMERDEGIVNAGYNIGDGALSGAGFLECLWNGPLDFETCGSKRCRSPEDRYATQACFTQSCEAVGQFSRAYLDCAGDNLDTCQRQCTAAASEYQTLCAITAVAEGGCAEKFGSDGSDGTCATSAESLHEAEARCRQATRQQALDQVCRGLPQAAGGCAEVCDVPDAMACSACLGSVDFVQTNTSCRNVRSLRCLGEQVQAVAESCVKECFAECLPQAIGTCTIDCLSSGPCGTETSGLLGATCK